jgi:hypothetical protein
MRDNRLARGTEIIIEKDINELQSLKDLVIPILSKDKL